MYEWICAYGFHLVVYSLCGIILVYPERGINSASTGLTLMTLGYNIGHRILHWLPTDGIMGSLNLHVWLHHNKLWDVSRFVELVLEFIFEFVVVSSIPVLIMVVTNEWVIPFSIILFCSLFFAMNHVLFYSILPSNVHQKHHKDNTINFIPDYLDHLFGTNADSEYEDMTLQVPLLVISCLVVYFSKAYFKWID